MTEGQFNKTVNVNTKTHRDGKICDDNHLETTSSEQNDLIPVE